jgi:hypothetical protein
LDAAVAKLGILKQRHEKKKKKRRRKQKGKKNDTLTERSCGNI